MWKSLVTQVRTINAAIYVHQNMFDSYCIFYTVGQFNDIPATQYCMVVSNTQLEGSVFNESSDEDLM